MVWVFWLWLLRLAFLPRPSGAFSSQQYAPSLWAGLVNYVRLASLDLVPASRFRGEGNASPQVGLFISQREASLMGSV